MAQRFLALMTSALFLSSCGSDDGGAPPEPDVDPPRRVTDLEVTNATTTSVSLNWTAPGDDGDQGRVAGYDLRFSTNLITSSNWAEAAQTPAPAPRDAGLIQTATVPGLEPSVRYFFALTASDDSANESELSNVVEAVTKDLPDIVAPAAITDLSVVSVTDSSVTLSWTAPGDDGRTGTAIGYDIRYSTDTITEDNWDQATLLSRSPIPRPAGSNEIFAIEGLDAETFYSFAIMVADEVFNWSDLSNVVEATTLPGGRPRTKSR